MSESFAELFEKSIENVQFATGAIVKGTVIEITDNYVIVDAGFKSEAMVPREQFYNLKGELEIAIGDEVDVTLDSIEDGYGETRLSREKAKRIKAWNDLDNIQKTDGTIPGLISGRVKGGFTVELGVLRGFLPGSLVDTRPVRDASYLEGKELDLKIIKLDPKQNNIVLSRKAVLEAVGHKERAAVLERIEEGQIIKGVVKNLTDYGAFVDLGGIDGLLHVTDMSWKRVKHPSEVVTAGDEVEVKVLQLDRDKNRVSLGLKQLQEDPWAGVERRYPPNTRIYGKVSNISDYGCFVELEEGVEGLVHVSEMDWTNKNINPNKIVKMGDEVEVMVLEVNEKRRRISLGLKQCKENPWKIFAENHNKGDKIVGTIKSITDFGIFIGLEGDIDGLVHLSDLSWDLPGEKAIREYTKGQELENIILAMDPDRERISLGVKQLDGTPLSTFLIEHDKGSVVSGTVIEVDDAKAVIDLGNEVQGHITANQIARGKVEPVHEHLKVDDTVKAQFIGVDNKNRVVNLSIKLIEGKGKDKKPKKKKREKAPTAEAPSTSTSATLGDILKEQLQTKDEKDES